MILAKVKMTTYLERNNSEGIFLLLLEQLNQTPDRQLLQGGFNNNEAHVPCRCHDFLPSNYNKSTAVN